MPLRLLSLLLLFVSSTLSFPVLSAAERIISLAPHATELAYAAGLGDKLVAVSDYSDYPEAAKNLERVANYQGIKLERIVALQPDLVLVWPTGNPAKEIAKLKSLGIHTYSVHKKSLHSIADSIDELSQYSDTPAIGKANAQAFRQRLAQLKSRYSELKKTRFFYQLSEKPIITVAQGNWPNEVFEFCGGVNVFNSSAVPYPQVSIEQVIVKQPDVFFDSKAIDSQSNLWKKWQAQLPAIEKGNTFHLNPDWLNRPTPRSLLAVEQVCQHFENVHQNN